MTLHGYGSGRGHAHEHGEIALDCATSETCDTQLHSTAASPSSSASRGNAIGITKLPPLAGGPPRAIRVRPATISRDRRGPVQAARWHESQAGAPPCLSMPAGAAPD